MSRLELVERWDAQQAAYIAHRETRFGVILDVLELHTDGPTVVLDLGCGPGSLSARVLQRFEQATVVCVDTDPMLLELAREYLAPFGSRARIVDADLTDPSWFKQLGDVADNGVDAAVSTTALHWLVPEDLLRLYRTVHALLTPDGLLLNGDHFRFDHRAPMVERWSARHDQLTQEAAFAQGVEDWHRWWEGLGADPEIGPLRSLRAQRFAGREGTPPVSVDFQLAALTQAGFRESGTVWQLFDDYVVYGVK